MFVFRVFSFLVLIKWRFDELHKCLGFTYSQRLKVILVELFATTCFFVHLSIGIFFSHSLEVLCWRWELATMRNVRRERTPPLPNQSYTKISTTALRTCSRGLETLGREGLFMLDLESREGCCCSDRKGGCSASFCQARCWRWVSKAQTSSADCRRSVAMFMAEWLKDRTPKSQHFSYGEICVIIHRSRVFCLLALMTLQPYGIS